MTTVYLSNSTLQVAVGAGTARQITAEKLYTSHEFEGCVINGVITDADAFQALISGFWKKYALPAKDVRLVIDSSQFATKLLSVPSMGREKTLRFLKAEFSGVERAADPVYGYYVLEEDKKAKLKQVFAAMAERGFIDTHVRLFAAAGIAVTSVEPALGSAIRLLGRLPALRGRTAMVQVADAMNMTTALFSDGRYIYSSRRRFFSTAGTGEFAAEVAQSVSNLVQFASTQNLPAPVSEVFLCGLTPRETAMCRDSILDVRDDLRVADLDGAGVVSMGIDADGRQTRFCDYLCAVAGLSQAAEQVDLCAQHKLTPKALEQRRKKRRLAVPLAALAVVVVGAVAALLLVRGHYRAALQDVRDYNSQPQVLADYAEYNALQLEIQDLTRVIGARREAMENARTYPVVDGAVNAVLQRCVAAGASAEIAGYDAATGELQIAAAVADLPAIYDFIARLKLEPIFVGVDYTGYAYDDEAGLWNVNVVCVMAPGTEVGE